MEIYEITGYQTGVSQEGVNYLEPSDSFEEITNGFIHRQVLQSRKGFSVFSTGYLAAGHLPTRVTGIFEHIHTTDNSIETLVFDKNYAYTYNEGTNALDRIPFGGTLAAHTFGLTNNEDFISGTTYPEADGSNRFVFTGKGMTNVYFYDGTNILDFANVVDNPNYEAFATGDINKAYHVIWFGERINFLGPTINSQYYPQGMLYSGIRNTAGGGDKFNTTGSGLLQLDTYNFLQGAKILGDRIIVNMSQSNWIIEKTRDVFNPYFPRKIPSVLGTDAPFSTVVWNDQAKSIGQTGILVTDGRQSLRTDNKIPDFTEDEVDSLEFEQIYGGFDRANSQFLWSYVESGSESSTQNRVLVNNYEESSWSIFDMSFSCFGESSNGENLTWNDIDETESPAWLEWDTTEETWNKIGLGAKVQKTLAGDDAGFVYQLNQDYDDHLVAITAITKASEAVLSTGNQNLEVNDNVMITGVLGMTEINNIPCVVTARTVSTVTVNIDSTDFTTYTSVGVISDFISFSAKTIPFNPYRAQGRKCYISHVEFLIESESDAIYLDIFMDGESAPFKSNELLQVINTEKSREWVTVTVNNICEFAEFTIRHKSASAQMRLTSMRIHAEMAELTSG